jgi:tetratricopeptide (TPR) repeat protein
MSPGTIERALMAAAIGALVLSASATAQYREYYVRGRVVDTQKQPIPGVEIQLSDAATSRTFHLKTEKDGTFKFAGLPHGVYQATLTKEGYPATRVEWKFEAPQDTMQRADIPDIVLASQVQVQKLEEIKATESGTREAAEKIKQRDFDGAIPLLKGLLDKDPKNVSALFFLGLSYVGKQMYREAAEALTQVAQLNPAFPGAYFELGICYGHLGDKTKALEAYDKSLEQDATSADSAYNSGLILFETNRVDEALVRFEKVLALKPADEEALEMTGRCFINQGKFTAAVERLERARAATTDPAKIASLDEIIRKLRAQVR